MLEVLNFDGYTVTRKNYLENTVLKKDTLAILERLELVGLISKRKRTKIEKDLLNNKHIIKKLNDTFYSIVQYHYNMRNVFYPVLDVLHDEQHDVYILAIYPQERGLNSSKIIVL